MSKAIPKSTSQMEQVHPLLKEIDIERMRERLTKLTSFKNR
jgi:hypothetical protein